MIVFLGFVNQFQHSTAQHSTAPALSNLVAVRLTSFFDSSRVGPVRRPSCRLGRFGALAVGGRLFCVSLSFFSSSSSLSCPPNAAFGFGRVP